MTEIHRWVSPVAGLAFLLLISTQGLASTVHSSTGATGVGEPSEAGSPGGVQSGGYYDDGFIEDDWFYDFYEIQPTKEARGDQTSRKDHRKDYQAEQLYEDARTSGLFEF